MIRQFLGQSLVYGATTILSRGTVVVMLLVLPLFLDPRDYGALSMITTVAALVTIFAPLEVTQGLARVFIEADERDRRLYASSAWLFTLGMLLLYLSAAQALAKPLCLLVLGDLSYLPVFRIGLSFMAFNALFYFLQHQFRWRLRTLDYAAVSIVFSFLTLCLALGLGFTWAAHLQGVVVGQTIGAGVAVAFGIWRLRHDLALTVDRQKLAEMLWLSLPIVPASLSFYFSVYASRLILNGAASLQEVGVFSFASQIASIAMLATAGIQAAIGPFILSHYREPETPRTLGRFFEAFVAVGLCLSLLLGLFSPELIRAFGNPAYAEAGGLVLLLSLTVVMSQIYMFAPGFLIAKKPVWNMLITIAGAAISIGANLILIPRYGMVGAAVASLLSSLAFVSMWFAASHCFYPVPVRWGRVTGVSSIAALAGLYVLSRPYPDLVAALSVKMLLILAIAALAWIFGLFPLGQILGAARGALRRRRSPDPAPP